MRIVNKIKYVFIILLFVHLTSELSWAQNRWYASTSLQMVGSDFQGGSNNNSFYFYNGLRYQTQSFSLGLSVPLILLNNDAFTQTTDLNISANNMGSGDMGSMRIGLGDLYLNSSLQVFNETENLPTISIDGYIKVPTSAATLGIGTNKFDAQIALGLRKFINNFSLLAQFGHIFLGKTDGSNIIDPYTISLGIGYSFSYGQHSILLAYDSYTKLITNTASPKQLALGYNYMISTGLYFTTIVSAGLNSSTSNYTISGGLNIKL